MAASETESEPVSPILSIHSLVGEEGAKLEAPTPADVDFSLGLEETKKQR